METTQVADGNRARGAARGVPRRGEPRAMPTPARYQKARGLTGLVVSLVDLLVRIDPR